MKLGLELRAVGLLRRIARALELANDLKEEELDRAKPHRRGRLLEVGVASTEEWDLAYRRSRGEDV